MHGRVRKKNFPIFVQICRMSESHKSCPECGDRIKGRADKKFCSDACRNSYNNKLNSDVNATVRNINNSLRKNRRVLESLWQVDKDFVRVSLAQLSKAGFDFNYFTQIYTTKTGNVYFYIYDFGYRKLEEEKYLIVRNKTE